MNLLRNVVVAAVMALSGPAIAAAPVVGESVIYREDSTHTFVAVVSRVVDSSTADIQILSWGTLWTLDSVVYTSEGSPLRYAAGVVRGSGDGEWLENPDVNVAGPPGATGGTGATGATGTTGAVGPAGPGFGTLVTSSPGRSLNSTFTPSTTKLEHVSYSVTVSNALTLTGGSDGYVSLRIGGTERARCGGGQTGAVVVGVTLSQPSRCQLTWFLNPNETVNLTTVNVTGTPTYTLDTVAEQTLN